MNFYVDGFLIPVPKAKLDEYRALAKQCAEVWIANGALEYHETVADDVTVGELTSFPRAVHQTDDETCVFSWIVYRSREERDSINEKVMKDPLMANMSPDKVPFDGKRLIFGGFTPLVSVKREA